MQRHELWPLFLWKNSDFCYISGIVSGQTQHFLTDPLLFSIQISVHAAPCSSIGPCSRIKDTALDSVDAHSSWVSLCFSFHLCSSFTLHNSILLVSLFFRTPLISVYVSNVFWFYPWCRLKIDISYENVFDFKQIYMTKVYVIRFG